MIRSFIRVKGSALGIDDIPVVFISIESVKMRSGDYL